MCHTALCIVLPASVDIQMLIDGHETPPQFAQMVMLLQCWTKREDGVPSSYPLALYFSPVPRTALTRIFRQEYSTNLFGVLEFRASD